MKLYALRVSSYDYAGDDIWAVYEDEEEAEVQARLVASQPNRSAWVETVDLITK